MTQEVPNTEKVKVSVNCRNTAGSAPEKIMERQDYDHKTVPCYSQTVVLGPEASASMGNLPEM